MSKLVCSNAACRGNAPCESCRLWLTEVIQYGIDRSRFATANVPSDLRSVMANVESEIMKSIVRELTKNFANVMTTPVTTAHPEAHPIFDKEAPTLTRKRGSKR